MGGDNSKWQYDTYECDPGCCIIINNMKFDWPNTDLDGGIEDEQKLTTLFIALGFTVIVHQNVTAYEMRSTVEQYSCKDHNGRVFILIILSHGGKGDVVCGTDGEAVEVEQLKQMFHTTRCPSLDGVPKVFLIDACRGDESENESEDDSEDESEDESEDINDCCHTKSMHSSMHSSVYSSSTTSKPDSDLVIVWASTRGSVAYMYFEDSTEKGSYFTQTLVQVFTEADDNKEFNEIIQEVGRRIQSQTVETHSTLIGKYYIKRNTKMNDLQELQKNFTEAVCQWLPFRNETIQDIEDTAKKLQEHHRNVNISRIAGSTASIAGTGMAILGLGLAPFTFGASLGISAAGIGIAAAGGATVAGASIADIFIEKSNLEDVQKRIDRDFEKVKEIQRIAERMKNIIQDIRKKCPEIGDDTFLEVFAAVFTQGVFRGSSVGFKIAELVVAGSVGIGASALRLGGAVAKGIAGAALALNIVLIPIDLMEIVRSGISLGEGSQTKAIEKLNALALELEDQKESLKAQANI